MKPPATVNDQVAAPPALPSRLLPRWTFWFATWLAWAGAGAGAAAAEIRLFPQGNQTIPAEEITAEAPVYFRALRFNEFTEEWNVDLVVSNRSDRAFASPLYLTFEDVENTLGPLYVNQVTADAPPTLFVRIDNAGPLAPGQLSRARTVELGYLEGPGAPRMRMRVYGVAIGSPYALGLTRTLDEAGLPLPGTRIVEHGPDGDRVLVTDAVAGVATLGGSAGEHVWRFEREAHLSVWRQETLVTGAIRLVANPRLARRNTNGIAVPAGETVALRDAVGHVQIDLQSSNPTVAYLTIIDGQTLPGLLPHGWSPLRAFWLEGDSAAVSAGVALRPDGPMAPGETATLVRWNGDTIRWEVIGPVPGNGSNAVRTTLTAWGAYALVVSDTGALAPPPPTAGLALPPSVLPPQPDPIYAAVGTVTPASSPASATAGPVTARAIVRFTNRAGFLPSGALWRTEVRENYRLQDSTPRFTASYETFIAAYRRPAATTPTALEAVFAVRPQLLFGADELGEATVQVDVLALDRFRGGVFDARGGELAEGGVRIRANRGELTIPQAAALRVLVASNFSGLLVPGQSVAAAFALTMPELEPGRRLGVHWSNAVPQRHYVLARVLSGLTFQGLAPIERLRGELSGALTSLEPTNGAPRLPGLRASGQYLLIQVTGPSALIAGVTRNAQGQPAAGLPVTISAQPWLTFSDGAGAYRLIAPTGAVELATTDLVSGDTDYVGVQVTDPDVAVLTDLGTRPRGPRVASVSPAPGARQVSAVTPITVAFTSAINPGALVVQGIQLLGTNGQTVPASLTLNLRNTVVTLLPNNPLSSGATYTIAVSTNLVDLAGRRLEGTARFTFQTVAQTVRSALAQLIIFEPGATNISAAIRAQLVAFDPVRDRAAVVAFGSAGTAEADVPVILANETTGETSTVRSKLDGSFYGFVRADVDDFISAVFVNANGSRTTVPATEQRFDDNRIGLYRAGGILEAESNGVPVQVLIDPGVVTTRSTFLVEPLALTELLRLLKNTTPQNATLLGGFRFQMEGDAGEGGSHVRMPIDVSAIPLGPGETAENGAYVLTIAREVDGKMTFQVVDKMKFENGTLTTASPPFDGMVESALRNTPSGVLAGAVLSAIVLPMYLGQGGVTVTGRAIEIPEADLQSPDGNLASDIALFIANQNLNALLQATQARPISGVFVTLRQPGTPQSFRAGTFPDGVVYSTTDRNGRYAMISPLGLGGGVVSGYHPRFGNPPSEPLLPYFDFQITGGVFEKDLFFVRPLATSADTPPRLSAGHTPTYPTPSNATVVEITASHAAGAPNLLQVVDAVYPLVPGLSATVDNVVLGAAEDLIQGTRIRRRLSVRADQPIGVRLRLTANVDAAGGPAVQTIQHTIEFLGESPRGTNPIVAIDPADALGPAVVESTPPPGGVLTLGDSIVLRFNEPISRSILDAPQYVTMNSPFAGTPALRLSPDQQTLTVSFARLEPDASYTLTMQTVTDLLGNSLDQRPREPGNQEYTLNFHTSKIAVRTLPGIEFGGGVVMNRHIVFALDRGQNGSLRVISALDPGNPVPLAHVPLPGPPRDLVFIPRYSFRTSREAGSVVQTRDLLAVVGGELGSSTVDRLGDVTFEGQFLRVFDVSDPANPTPIVRTIVTRRPNAVTKIRWQPPCLAYLESGQLYEVGFINLQEMILGFSLSLAERADLPFEAVPGVDRNGDGDFVDEDESLPIPSAQPLPFFGKQFGLTPADSTTQKLLDFDFAVDAGQIDWVGVTLSGGNRLISSGLLDPIVGPAVTPGYRTLLFQGVDTDPEGSVLRFGAGAIPKRVVGRLNARLRINGVEEARAIALVSLAPDTDGVTKLAVIDISLPDSPRLLRLIPFPVSLGLGLLQSVTVRPDGLLALATTTDTVLLDERRLAEPSLAGTALHPAIVGVLPGTGSGNISLGATDAGLFAVNLGGRAQLLQTAPRIEFVTFTGENGLVDPAALAGDEALRRRVLASTNLAFRSRLFPARYRAAGGAASTLSPPAPQLHYYVLVYAPGGPPEHREILLGLQSLNRAGDAYRNKGFAFPPVQALSAQGLDGIGQELRPLCDAATAPLKAHRVSNDPHSDFYNLYLSDPFALTYERMSQEEVATLQTADAPRRLVLWSGFGLRAFIDPSAASDSVVGVFAATPHPADLRLKLPAVAQVECFPAAYIVGPNPPPVGGELAVPGSFGTVNAANGEFRHSTMDVELPSRLMNIRFVRTAANQDLVDGPFGPGWDFNYNQHLIEMRQEVFPQGSVDPLVVKSSLQKSKRARPGDVKFVDGAGRVVLFRNLGSNAPSEIASDPLVQDSRLGWLTRGGTFFKPDDNEKGVFDLLYKFPDGQFVRLTPAGVQYFYDKLGRLEKILHRYERNRHLLHYNERGELLRIEDKSVDSPRFLDLGYYRKAGDQMFDPELDLVADLPLLNGRIARLVDYAGRETKFEYSPEGILARRLGPEVPGVNFGFAGRPTTTYLSGNDCGQVIGVTAGTGANGAGGNAGTPLFAAAMPPNGDGLPVASGGTSASGAVSIQVPTDNSAATIGGSTSSSSGPDLANNAATTATFDDNGYPRSLVMTGAGAGNNTAEYQTHFNDFGLLESITYPEGNSAHHTYATDDAVFRSRGNLMRTELRAGSRPVASGTPNPLAATYRYDKKYNQPSGPHQDFNEFVAVFELTEDRRNVSRVSYSTGQQHRFEQYNAFGQLERQVTPEGLTVEHGYDATRGFLLTRKRGGLTTTFGYDTAQIAGQLGAPTSKTPPLNASIEMAYTPRLQLTLWKRGDYEEKRGYDENGNVVYLNRTLDTGESYEETRSYSQINFLESRTIKNVEVNGELTSITHTYTPDDAKRVRQIITAPAGVTRTFQYDHLGNLIRESTGDHFIDYSYDRNSNLTGVKPKGTLAREIHYDGYDRPQQFIEMPGEGGNEITTLSYFGGGALRTRHVTGATGGDVEDLTVTGIDPLGRPTGLVRRGEQASAAYQNITYTANNGLTTLIPGPRDTTTIVQDAAGRLRRVTDSLADVEYRPNDNGQVEQITSRQDGGRTYNTFYEYNELDHLRRVRDDLAAVLDFGTPRLDGLPKTITDIRGKSSTVTYTRLGELKSLLRPLGVLVQFHYDPHRLPSAVLDAENKGNRFDYDGTMRLEKWTLRSGQDQSFAGPDVNNLPNTTTLPGGGSETVAYDNLGRAKERASTHDGQNYDVTGITHDALSRVRALEYSQGLGSAHAATFDFDMLGPLTSAVYDEFGESYPVTYTIDTDSTYKSVSYPSGVTVHERRQPSGRLGQIDDQGGVILVIDAFQGADLPRQSRLGANILERNDWDMRRRLLTRRYTLGSSNGLVLADLRYAYDQGYNPVVRQSVHRHGRADLFQFDDADRLDFFESGARPAVPGAAARNPVGLFGGSGFAPGFFARDYVYGNSSLDLLTRGELFNPDNLARQGQGAAALLGPVVPVFAATQSGHDTAFGRALGVDSFTFAAPDALGNAKEGMLFTRPSTPNASDAMPLSAELFHNARQDLVRVVREDNLRLEYHYQPGGLVHHRVVQRGAATIASTHFVWDRSRLIEEWDTAGASPVLRARYYYADTDAPVAADLPDGAGGVVRHYYLRDHADSVIGVANAQGQVVERVHYDAWGQPVIEARDTAPPVIALVRQAGSELVVAFTETVMPPLIVPAQGLGTGTAPLTSRISVVTAAGPGAVTATYRENEPGFLFGSVVRVAVPGGLNGAFQLNIQAGALVDEWGNPNPLIALSLNTTAATAPILHQPTNQAGTAARVLARSAIGNPFLFHGQYFDYDTGLLYLRARWYEPFTGQFLERDPMQYEDSPNLYAGFANNPLSNRDPTGMNIRKVGRTHRGGPDHLRVPRPAKPVKQFDNQEEGLKAVGAKRFSSKDHDDTNPGVARRPQNPNDQHADEVQGGAPPARPHADDFDEPTEPDILTGRAIGRKSDPDPFAPTPRGMWQRPPGLGVDPDPLVNPMTDAKSLPNADSAIEAPAATIQPAMKAAGPAGRARPAPASTPQAPTASGPASARPKTADPNYNPQRERERIADEKAAKEKAASAEKEPKPTPSYIEVFGNRIEPDVVADAADAKVATPDQRGNNARPFKDLPGGPRRKR